ncbi:MAG: nitric oxide synthase [Candidatus Bathyarchaeota archaeon]|nr:nitric oxide synthase [Candidatus Bathyarchaeota archaeon]
MKTLIVYGTRWGNTADIAKKIGEVIINNGNTVEIVDAKKTLPKVDSYDLVVIGSGISMGKWTKETLEFLKANAAKLRDKKTAFFVSCGLILREGGVEKTQEDYLAKVADTYELQPVDFGAFGGCIDFNGNYGILGSLFVKSSKNKCRKIGIDTTKRYDFRNWADISKWAEKVAVDAKT